MATATDFTNLQKLAYLENNIKNLQTQSDAYLEKCGVKEPFDLSPDDKSDQFGTSLTQANHQSQQDAYSQLYAMRRLLENELKQIEGTLDNAFNIIREKISKP